MNRFHVLAAAAFCVASAGAAPATLLDLPVSSVGNAAYLTSASSRPWWNKDWTRRAPILLSSEAKVLRPGTVVDVIVDFGEEVKPEDVRVVTMWETEVDCVAERVRRTDTPVRSGMEGKSVSMNGQECPFSETTVRLLFRSDFRIEENRPFLVYWGRKARVHDVARASSPLQNGETTSSSQGEDALATKGDDLATISMPPIEETPEEIVFRNGLIEVAFDKHVWAGGLIKRLRVPGSGTPSELLQRATGPAWNGFNISFGNKPPVWSAPKVVTDNAFVKEVAFDCPQAEVRLALYAEQPRVDWLYRLKAAEGMVFLMNTFAVGGSTTHDKIFYPGVRGKVLSLDASLDQATDCIPWPHFENLHKSLGDGWLAIADTKRSEVVGLVFDRPALNWMIFSGHFASGELVSMRFRHGGTDRSVRSPTGDGTDRSVRSPGGVSENGHSCPFASGAIVAAMGSWPRVREESDRLRGAIQVRVGAAESVREIPVAVPRLDRDWIADFNVGATPLQGHPLESGDWATNICNRLRSYGANTIKTGAWYVWDLPLTRGLYDTMTNAVAPAKRRPYPVWEEGKFTGRKLKEETSAAHAKGMAMSNWPDYMGGFWWVDREIRRADPVCRQIDRDVESLFADCGIDSVHNWQFGGEGLPLPKDVRNKHGEHYWKWPKEAKNGYFDSVGEQHRCSREFYADSKKRHPDLPVFVYTSENGEMLRDFMTTELAGHFDTLYVEMLPHGIFSETKHTAKRMRALFGNRAGHTVHHHFYFYDLTEAQRVCEVEQPFVYGINGFSVENLLYEQADVEYSEIVADFYRFMECTRLGEKVARMAPVKDVAVFRDDRAFRQDVLENRVGRQYAQRAQQDARVRAFGEMPSFTYDVVINKYFTAKDLAQYKAVYIPEDDALSEECVKELLEYVKAGGGAVVEGVTGEKVKRLGEGEERRTDTLVRSEKETSNSILQLQLDTPTQYGAGRIVWTKEVLTDALAKRDRKAMSRVKALLKSVGSEPPFVVEGSDCYGLDAVLQASDEGMFLGVINQGKEKQKGTMTIHCPPPPSTSTSLYVLDVKRGVRSPFTNSFDIAVGGNQCSYYLIGDDAFTAIPAPRAGESRSAFVRSVAAKGEPPDTIVDTNFTRVAAVEFVPLVQGKPVEIRRSRLAAIDVTSVTPESYDAAAVRKALRQATYVHFLGTAEKVDAVFADCATELKAMLSRGGALLIDRSPVGSAGHAFLGSVGVFDASEGMLSGVGDTYAVWNESVSTNVPLHAARHAEIGNRWSLQYDKVYAKWDAPKQVAPLLARLDSTKAMVVYQENVCGTGKVVFNGNVRSFTDWYENAKYGDNILTWVIGMKTDEHAKKVEQLNGGLGTPVE